MTLKKFLQQLFADNGINSSTHSFASKENPSKKSSTSNNDSFIENFCDQYPRPWKTEDVVKSFIALYTSDSDITRPETILQFKKMAERLESESKKKIVIWSAAQPFENNLKKLARIIGRQITYRANNYYASLYNKKKGASSNHPLSNAELHTHDFIDNLARIYFPGVDSHLFHDLHTLNTSTYARKHARGNSMKRKQMTKSKTDNKQALKRPKQTHTHFHNVIQQPPAFQAANTEPQPVLHWKPEQPEFYPMFKDKKQPSVTHVFGTMFAKQRVEKNTRVATNTPFTTDVMEDAALLLAVSENYKKRLK